MVDAAVGHGARPLAVHGLGAVAVRVEQEPAVVVGSVPPCAARARRCRGTRRRSPPARRRPQPRGSARGTRRAGRGSRGARGPWARCPSPPTRRARRPRGWARPPARRGRCGRTARTRPGPRRRWRRGRTPRRGYRCGHARAPRPARPARAHLHLAGDAGGALVLGDGAGAGVGVGVARRTSKFPTSGRTRCEPKDVAIDTLTCQCRSGARPGDRDLADRVDLRNNRVGGLVDSRERVVGGNRARRCENSHGADRVSSLL